MGVNKFLVSKFFILNKDMYSMSLHFTLILLHSPSVVHSLLLMEYLPSFIYLSLLYRIYVSFSNFIKY